MRGHAPGQVIGRVEAAEVRADDLLGGIALDALGARVPAGHAALRIQHEDGVVGDPLDQQPELLLAAAQGLLGRPSLGQVTGDLGIADDVAVG